MEAVPPMLGPDTNKVPVPHGKEKKTRKAQTKIQLGEWTDWGKRNGEETNKDRQMGEKMVWEEMKSQLKL